MKKHGEYDILSSLEFIDPELIEKAASVTAAESQARPKRTRVLVMCALILLIPCIMGIAIFFGNAYEGMQDANLPEISNTQDYTQEQKPDPKPSRPDGNGSELPPPSADSNGEGTTDSEAPEASRPDKEGVGNENGNDSENDKNNENKGEGGNEKPPVLIDAESYLTIDINPSFQLAIENSAVVGVLAVNDDGERILEGLELNGLSVEDALKIVIDRLISEGYLASDESKAPVLLLSAKGNESSSQLLEEAVTVTTDQLAINKLETFIVTQRIEDEELVTQLAREYGVSAGKMQYVLNLLEQEADLTIENASAMTIVELFGVDIEKRLIQPPYKVGDYDEYGELVLYAGTVESYAGYVPWEKLSKEYKDELAQMYTPEALAILAMPRVWTTVPNVVGLPADEALELLYSRNIAPCICYMDSTKARELGYTDGTCYEQDIPQGWRWNSDACIHIWILIDEGKNDEQGNEEPEKPEPIFNTKYITETDGRYMLHLHLSPDVIEILPRYYQYIPYIHDDLVEIGEKDLKWYMSQNYYDVSELFLTVDDEGYLCFAAEGTPKANVEIGPDGEPNGNIGTEPEAVREVVTARISTEALELP